MAKTASKAAAYQCTECGYRTAKWMGRCPECQAWATLVEVSAPRGTGARVQAVTVSKAEVARPITEISAHAVGRYRTGIEEFDRVLGGGLVPGAAILLSGEPGVGKSSLLLKVAYMAASRGARVLYVSGEESAGQIRMRAERTGALAESLLLVSDTDLGRVLGQIEATAPDLLIIDSVQTLAAAEVDGIAGQPSQVREVATSLIRVAKERDLPTVMVGHVTKDGQVAGPRVLEHLVDVVCHFEGDRQTALRFVRALKNRFGPTDEVGCFEMRSEGIEEVPDPSSLFTSATPQPVSGSAITIALEGRRALPVEVQALVNPTTAPNPRRVTNGVDTSRVLMLLAVLERRAGIKLSDKDVYVSTVGGVRLDEPAADLAIATAIASVSRDRPVGPQTAVWGEVSLTGDLRQVTQSAQRRSEAKRLGYTTVIDADAESLTTALARALQ